MSNIAIRAEGLGKQYFIGQEQKKYNTIRESLTETLSAPIVRARQLMSGNASAAANLNQILWALKDVSFKVDQGEVVGIIGHNGAGKSTLLKVLSRITDPTEGTIDLYGRVGSLLEVGTGFHPELTGRENIYLNGAILGMRRTEIDRKFDEIVAFAEVERFIDTPIKRYSSGMGLRLGFAVAAHLEPDILVVDEVLAVGDASFQAKCLGKMEAVGKGGRTVLFVSHNMQAMLRLCPRVILLERGRVIMDGPSDEVVSFYRRSSLGVTSQRQWVDEDEKDYTVVGDDAVQLRAMRVYDPSRAIKDVFDIDKPLDVEVEYEVLESGLDLSVAVGFYNADGVCLFIVQDVNNPDWSDRPREKGLMRSTVHIPAHFFAEGSISLNLVIKSENPRNMHVHEKDIVSFTVADRTEGDGVRGKYSKRWRGVMRPMLDWTVDYVTLPTPKDGGF